MSATPAPPAGGADDPCLDADGRLDVARLRLVRGRLGGQPGGIHEAADGRRWYVKTLETADHVANEWQAAALYRLAGAPVLRHRLCVRPQQIATDWQALRGGGLAGLDEAGRRQACHWLGVHAWTANWDCVGLFGDNLGVTPEGRVLTLDVGGALRYRAQGDPKGAAFGPEVGELRRLREDPDNPQARRLFRGMAADALQAAVRVVTDLPPQAIRDCLAAHGARPALAGLLLARQADLARQLAGISRRPGP